MVGKVSPTVQGKSGPSNTCPCRPTVAPARDTCFRVVFQLPKDSWDTHGIIVKNRTRSPSIGKFSFYLKNKHMLLTTIYELGILAVLDERDN